MFRDYPDCRTINFYDLSGVSREIRVEAVEKAAKQAGWSVELGSIAEGGTRVDLSRDGYTARVSIKDHTGYWQTYCKPMSVGDRDFVEHCTDSLQVQRERV